MSLSGRKKRILEVIVTSVEEAILAESGGADRLELIRDFEVGGLTPPLTVVADVLASVNIPVRVMVREQANFSLKDESEATSLREILASLTTLKIDGAVFGFIENELVDTKSIGRLLRGHEQLKLTFHRAFEAASNPFEAIKAMKEFPQIDKILTNGGGANWGAVSWTQRIERMQSWQQIASPITILVGGEVESNALEQMKTTELQEFHVGRSVRTPETTSGKVDPAKIRQMRQILD
jgi:copper homeostasis protein